MKVLELLKDNSLYMPDNYESTGITWDYDTDTLKTLKKIYAELTKIRRKIKCELDV